jgi:hypothetical protein
MRTSTQSVAPKLLLWGLVFVGAWLALSGFASYLVHRNALQWPTVDGEISRAEVVKENDYYFVRLEYAYAVDGVQYISDDVYLNTGIGGVSVSDETMGAETRTEAEAIRDAYPIGKRVSVHYQPEDPNRAALRFETTVLLVIGCFGAVVAGIALLPLKFPRLFQSVRDRLADDTELRFDRHPIVFTQDELKEFAQHWAAVSGVSLSDSGSILDASQYKITNWRPGDRVEFQRRGGGLLSRTPTYQVGFDWQRQVLDVGPQGSTESIPFSNIDELRVHGLHEVRHTSSAPSRASSSYEAWDVWLDAIVGSRRIRLASQPGYRDPDRAFCEALRPAAQLATSLARPLRWVGFENHPDYRPPRTVPGLNIATQIATSAQEPSPRGATPPPQSIASALPTDPAIGPPVAQPTLLETQIELRPSQPANSRISMEVSDQRIEVHVPRSRRVPDVQGFGIAVVCGGFAALISPAAFRLPDLGPRLFVGLLWLVPLVCLTQMVRKWARTGAMQATRSHLTVTRRGWIGSKRDRWLIADLLTICVVPSGEERNGLPIEELAVVSTDGTSKHYFSTCDNRELAWIAHEFRQFLGFPNPPAVTQSDPDKAVLEISRGLVNKLHDEMSESLENMQQARRRMTDLAVDKASPTEADELESMTRLSALDVAEKKASFTRSEVDAVRAEFGLIDFDVWQPGEVIRYRHTTLGPSALLASAIPTGLGYGLIFLFVVPFAIPILGTILVLPIDLIGSKHLHLVVADMMAFGTGLIAWIITFTLLAIALTYLKLDAAFAVREIEWDWQRRRLTIRGRRDEQVYSFQEIRQINIREARQPGARLHVIRMEAQLPGRTAVLLEADESDEIQGLAEAPMPAAERIRILAEDLASHLDIPIHLADPVVDRCSAVGYPRDARLTDIRSLWKNASGTTRTRAWALVAIILVFWTFRFVESYRANAPLVDSAAATEQP